ncbi:MAG: VanZ family protein [Eubacteriales bacterium]|nr:VanZ family protein [Eubacteriales bacterium]
MRCQKQLINQESAVRWAPAAAVMLLIFVHSAMPADLSREESGFVVNMVIKLFPIPLSTEMLTFAIRKTAHFIEYCILGLCLRRGAKTGICSFLAGAAYAVTDEIHQYFVPGRSCEIRDICIDAAGVLAGVVLMGLIKKITARIRPKM